MKANVKLKKKAALSVHSLGQRWVEGESIRKLADEARMPWNKLQAKLRSAGYLRSHKGITVPNQPAELATATAREGEHR